MHGYKENIEKLVVENNDFRRVLYTGKHSQLVAMTLQTGEEIGVEVHPENDQFFRFESGEGKVLIDGNEYAVADGDVAIVPAGAEHNIINTSATAALKLYTIYSPAHHRDGVIHTTKAIALADDEEFDGQATE
ncbi:MAG: cupin [Candidatus Magasanikbacteria bacterium RIFOXYA2_FULL_44_8]|uniref:Cupin n=1 Tax=Candidatus Magasanikbacteria bacterium RIFOXYA2_FULL_44_8 TaxID=1798696 RepID=A0A1F6NJX9_9BACT|nr:MAG: cupin [Candidatus Magasanikbacteria bacterium RIFOXYA2_FULL_44_8]